MDERASPPLAGVVRVVYFLAIAALGVTAIFVSVTSLYDEPSADETGFEDGFEDFDPFLEQDQETADYNRNLGLIFGTIGAGVTALGLLALGSRYNPLRAGMLAGGVAVVIVGVFLGSDGSDDWLTVVMSVLGLVVLIGCTPWLDDGLPPEVFSGRRVIRVPPPPEAPPPPPPAPPPLSGPPPGPGGFGGPPAG